MLAGRASDGPANGGMLFNTLTIVGVGLIGGSIGLAAKKRGVVQRVIGVGRDASRLDQARKLGAIDEYVLELASGVQDADFVVFCTPVDRIAAQIAACAFQGRTGAIFTDAGSTKSEIVKAVEANLPPQVRFLGSHPLAGSEKKGVEHASAELFADRVTVLTPTAKSTAQLIDSVRGFWLALGARVRIMSPQDHDNALALTSHLPHLLAAALAGILPDELCELAATGFRDTTRIASGDPDIWTPIMQQNRVRLLVALLELEKRLHLFAEALSKNDGVCMDRLLAEGKKVRDALGN